MQIDRSFDKLNRTTKFTYFDNRIAKSVDGDGAGEAIVERFVYDGDEIALTFDGQGNQTERFLHGTGIDQVLAQENAGGEVLWALTDHQGSVRMLLDNNGNITLETNPEVNFRFSYTGRELDAETGLYNYRSRFYDPAVGEFISEDRIGFAGGDANLSRYVTNSPVNQIDPYGYSGFCRIGSYGNRNEKDRLGDLWDTLKPARQFLDGFLTQSLLNETGGEVYIGLFDSKFNEGFASASNQSEALKLGRTAADALSILQGAAEISVGKVLEGAGIVFSLPSGGSSLVAVPAGAVLDVHGGVVAGSGIKDLTEIWRDSNNSDNLSPQFYESSSDEARRQVMRDQGIPTSQQPSSQSKNQSGLEYRYEVPKPGGGTQIKSVQQQTLDSSHPGQPHWEAGTVKTDPNTGEIQMNKHDRPKLQNNKSKVDYDG